MNTRNSRLKAASLVGLATLGGGVAAMSSAQAASTTTTTSSAKLTATQTSFIKSAFVQPPTKTSKVTGVVPSGQAQLVTWLDTATGSTYTQTYTLQTIGYMIASSNDLSATTATNTNVRTGPGVAYPIAATLKAGVTLSGETSSDQTLDLNNKVIDSSSTGHWMRITTGPYAGKFINTAVMKDLVPGLSKSAEGPRQGWALSSVTGLGAPAKI